MRTFSVLELKKQDYVKVVNYDLQMEKRGEEHSTVSHRDDSTGLGSAHLSLSLFPEPAPSISWGGGGSCLHQTQILSKIKVTSYLKQQ